MTTLKIKQTSMRIIHMIPFVTESCRISQKFGRICNYPYFCSVKWQNRRNENQIRTTARLPWGGEPHKRGILERLSSGMHRALCAESVSQQSGLYPRAGFRDGVGRADYRPRDVFKGRNCPWCRLSDRKATGRRVSGNGQRHVGNGKDSSCLDLWAHQHPSRL